MERDAKIRRIESILEGLCSSIMREISKDDRIAINHEITRYTRAYKAYTGYNYVYKTKEKQEEEK